MKICAIQNQVKSIFSLTRLSEVFEVFSDKASAEKKLMNPNGTHPKKRDMLGKE